MDGFTQKDSPRFVSLSNNLNLAFLEIDVLPVQRYAFGNPAAGMEVKLEQGPVQESGDSMGRNFLYRLHFFSFKKIHLSLYRTLALDLVEIDYLKSVEVFDVPQEFLAAYDIIPDRIQSQSFGGAPEFQVQEELQGVYLVNGLAQAELRDVNRITSRRTGRESGKYILFELFD